MPNIIFNVNAHQYYSKSFLAKMKNNSKFNTPKWNKRMSESNFYRGNTGANNIISYLTRKDSVEKESLEDNKIVNQLLKETNVTEGDIFSYIKDRPGSTGLWNKTGDVYFEEANQIQKKLSETKSTIWSSVISFPMEYALQNCPSKFEAQKLINNVMDDFINSNDMKPDNVDWFGAYHVNTDNPHIHLVFWEKSPQKIKVATGELEFSNWKIPKKSLDLMKEKIAFQHRENTNSHLAMRDLIRQSIIHDSKKTSYYTDVNLIKENLTSKQFNRLNKETKNLIQNFTNKILNDNPETLEMFQDYEKHLWIQQKGIISNYTENKIPIPAKAKNFALSRIDDFYTRTYNSVMKTLSEEFFSHENHGKGLTKKNDSLVLDNKNALDTSSFDVLKDKVKPLRSTNKQKQLESRKERLENTDLIKSQVSSINTGMRSLLSSLIPARMNTAKYWFERERQEAEEEMIKRKEQNEQ